MSIRPWATASSMKPQASSSAPTRSAASAPIWANSRRSREPAGSALRPAPHAATEAGDSRRSRGPGPARPTTQPSARGRGCPSSSPPSQSPRHSAMRARATFSGGAAAVPGSRSSSSTRRQSPRRAWTRTRSITVNGRCGLVQWARSSRVDASSTSGSSSHSRRPAWSVASAWPGPRSRASRIARIASTARSCWLQTTASATQGSGRSPPLAIARRAARSAARTVASRPPSRSATSRRASSEA